MFNDFTRSGHALLSAEIGKELEALGKRLGIKLSVGGGQYGADQLTIKVVATPGDPAVADAAAKQKFATSCHYYGLKAEDFGAIFTSQGKRYKLTGVSPSRPKYPISGECLSTGKTYKFTEATARLIIAARSTAAPAPNVPVMQTPQTQLPPSNTFAAPAGFPQF